MNYYNVCPYCGAHLDPGERCDCIEYQYAALTPKHKKMVDDEISALLTGQKNTALGVGSTLGGGVEQVLSDTVSTSIIQNRKDGSQA